MYIYTHTDIHTYTRVYIRITRRRSGYSINPCARSQLNVRDLSSGPSRRRNKKSLSRNVDLSSTLSSLSPSTFPIIISLHPRLCPLSLSSRKYTIVITSRQTKLSARAYSDQKGERRKFRVRKGEKEREEEKRNGRRRPVMSQKTGDSSL